MGPPPPPPPPPPLLSSTTLPSSGRKTTHAPRRDNNSLPAASNTTRPPVDSAALQHAAARLRKTGYYEQIRGDVPNLSDGRVAGTHQRMSDGDRSYGTQFNQLGGNSPREQIHVAPTHTYHTDSIGDVRGCAHTGLSNQNAGIPSLSSTVAATPRNPNGILKINPLSESVVETTTEKSDIYTNRNLLHSTAPSQRYRNLSPAHTYAQTPNDSLPQVSPKSAVYLERSYSPRSYSDRPYSPRSYSDRPYSPRSYSDRPYSPRSYPVQCSSPNRTFNNQTYTTEIIQQHQYNTSHPSAASLQGDTPYIPSSSLVLNPRARIRDYATHNYVEPDSPRGLDYVSTSARETFNRSSPHDFATSIRNQTLTPSQREANQYQTSTTRCDGLPFDVHKLYEQLYRGDEVDRLVSDMQTEMHVTTTPRASSTSRSNICVACQSQITFDNPGCTALNQVYHVACFKCKKCGCKLAGTSFYNIDDAPTCDSCYKNSLEKCNKCNQPITDRLLRACGGAFHVECFVCTSCRGTLDGIPFTTDANKDVFCVPCYQDKFAPRCAVCHKGIVPVEGEKESVRVVAMDKSFHPSCYRCEDCGLQLSSKVEGAGCYPLNSHLYCKTCNSNRLRLQATV